MINLTELKPGNWVLVKNEDTWMEGVVLHVNRDDGGQIEIETGVQKAWYEMEEVSALPLSEDYLLKMGFEREVMPDTGNVKYKHGAFRVLVGPTKRFTDFLMWYREEKSHITYPMTVHQFQNRYEAMCKVPIG